MTRAQHLVRISLDEIYDGHVLERKCLGKIIETCFVINYKLVLILAKQVKQIVIQAACTFCPNKTTILILCDKEQSKI